MWDKNTYLVLSVLALIVFCTNCQEQVVYQTIGPGKQLTQTQIQKNKQLEEYNSKFIQQQQFQQAISSFSFEFSQNIEQFYIHCPVDASITFLVKVLNIRNGGYQQIPDISKEAPVMVYVYINNNRVVHTQRIYFYAGFTFQGKKDSNYMIRFQSQKKNRSIMVEHTKLLDSAIFSDKLTSKSNEQNFIKLQQVKNKIMRVEGSLKRNHRLVERSQRLLVQGINRYTIYSYSQTIIALAVCFIQVQLIKKLVRPKSII